MDNPALLQEVHTSTAEVLGLNAPQASQAQADSVEKELLATV